MKFVLHLEAVLALSISSLAMAGIPVDFSDANLEAAVEAQLNVSDPSPQDMQDLTILYAQQAGISDLTGIEHASNLTELYLWENQIKDISSLAQLSQLTGLYLWSNQIEDVSPLSELNVLTVLALPDNQIQDISALSRLKNLTDIALSGNLITDVSPLAELTDWESLSLHENPLDNDAYCAKLHDIESNALYADYDPNPNAPENVMASQAANANELRIAWGAVCNGPSYTSYYRVYRSDSLSGAKNCH